MVVKSIISKKAESAFTQTESIIYLIVLSLVQELRLTGEAVNININSFSSFVSDHIFKWTKMLLKNKNRNSDLHPEVSPKFLTNKTTYRSLKNNNQKQRNKHSNTGISGPTFICWTIIKNNHIKHWKPKIIYNLFFSKMRSLFWVTFLITGFCFLDMFHFKRQSFSLFWLNFYTYIHTYAYILTYMYIDIYKNNKKKIIQVSKYRLLKSCTSSSSSSDSCSDPWLCAKAEQDRVTVPAGQHVQLVN